MGDTNEEVTIDSIKEQLLRDISAATTLTDRQVAVSTYHDFSRACLLDRTSDAK